MRLRYVLWIVLLMLLSLPHTGYAQSVSIPVSNSNWFFSPYNWYLPGALQAGGLSVNELITNQPGAYCTLSFVGSTQVTLNLDMLNVPAANGVTSLVVQWRIDGALSLRLDPSFRIAGPR